MPNERAERLAELVGGRAHVAFTTGTDFGTQRGLFISVAAYRDRVNAAADVEELLAEMIFADLDQVTVRVGKLEAALRKPSPAAQRDEQSREPQAQHRGAQDAEPQGHRHERTVRARPSATQNKCATVR